MKYIVIEINNTEVEEIVVFPNRFNHDEYLSYLRHTYLMIQDLEVTPVSAGFVIGDQCFGKSVTLGLTSREEDSKLLEVNY